MPKSPLQKLKILYIMDYLLHHTDEAHPAAAADLISYLALHDISAERKSIYSDLSALREYGLDILHSSGGYYVVNRDFELPELKLLVDSVQSSKFITRKKSAALIRKIEGLSSEYEARQLNRQVYVANRIKTMNESIYYNVDEIHTGILQNRQIRFRYFEYTVAKQKQYRHGGAYYTVSPFFLTWDNENYYLVAYDSAFGNIKHFRVDKMCSISVTDSPREGLKRLSELDMGMYTQQRFGMFTGTPTTVHLQFENGLVDAVLDRLGSDVSLHDEGNGCFTVKASVVVSPPFFGWICSFGGRAKILGPDEVAARMKAHISAIAALYS